MYLDAHAHLDHYTDAQLPQVLAELEALKVLTISVATDPASYRKACELATQSRWIIPTFGIHPWKAPEFVDTLESLQPLIDASPMLGELGLDYHWVEDQSAFPAQRIVLEHFLNAARKQNKRVNLHTKGAEAEILELLKHYSIERAIIHWYSGPLEIAKELAERGCWFTIGVEIHSSELIQELARQLPLSLLLTETDNPGGQEWLAGEVGMPHHVPGVVDALARLRNTEAEIMRQQIEANFAQLVAGDPYLTKLR